MSTIVADSERGVALNQKLGDARLVEFKSGASGPCVFLVPGTGGTGGRIDGFADLATLLATAMPVIAIEARGVDGNGEPDHDIQMLVGHYIDRVRTVQPKDRKSTRLNS